MRRLVAVAMACAALGIGISSGAYAASFKWASQGDILTFDPHAQNENLNNSANSYVYEPLVELSKGKSFPALPKAGNPFLKAMCLRSVRASNSMKARR